MANPYRYQEPTKYRQILNDFYKDEIIRRKRLLFNLIESPRAIGKALDFCSHREYFIDWMVDWCWTFDPRNASLGLPTTLPWIPWPKQIEFIEWLYTRYFNQENGLVEKARDAGATFLFSLVMLREWRWVEGFTAGIGSNKLENVDKRDNPKAIFPKIRSIMDCLPPWWMPTGFNTKKHDNIANLINPENRSNISGEGGDEIGRGDRRSMYFVDEAASLEHPEAAASALSRTTDSCFYLSTPKGMNWFGKKRHSGEINVFTFDWRSDPRLSEEWFQRYSAKNDPVIVAQEVLIDYHASVEGVVIPIKWIESAVDLKLNVSHMDTKAAGLDVAVGGKNNSAYVMRHGPEVQKAEERNYDNPVEVAHWAIEEAEKDMVQSFGYDSIGVGEGVKGVLKTRDDQPSFRHYALGGNEPTSDTYWDEYQKHAKDLFLNARAERWYRVKKRFEKTYRHVVLKIAQPHNELISIPNNRKLISQLASPLEMRTESGKIKIESKEHMKGRNIDSPDLADALIYSFAVDSRNLGELLFYAFDYTPKYDKYGIRERHKESFTKFKIDWGLVNGDENRRNNNYGSTYFDKKFNISHISAYWNPYRKKLFLYDCFTMNNKPPDFVAAKIRLSMESCIRKRCYFLEEGATKGVGDNISKLYKRSGINYLLNFRYDESGAIFAANQMFMRRQIVVHESMGDAKRQFSLWSKDMGQAKRPGFGLCFCLLNIVSLLKAHNQIDEPPPMKKYTPYILRPGGDINQSPVEPRTGDGKPAGWGDYFS